MQIDGIQGYKMTDTESQMSYESDESFQKVVDALNEIGCTSFMLSKEDIKRIIKNEKYQ